MLRWLRRLSQASAVLLLASVFASLAIGQSSKVIRVRITGMVDFGLAPLVQRVVEQAENEGAAAVFVDINTLGGRVDAMIEIRDILVGARVPTIAYVNPRAISAGALIAISCDSLYMAPGASIGAATPVAGNTGEKASEKIVSYARTEFRATAERKNRPADIAAAMVDESIVVEGLVEAGKLLTLSANKAVEVGFADGIYENREEILAHLDLANAQLVSVGANWAENFVRFLNNPLIAGLLMSIIFFGVIAEVQTAGWGVPGTAALIALVLFLGGRFVVGLVGLEELILLAIGAVLIGIEAFAIPGFGIVGFLGILAILASLILALVGNVPTVDDFQTAMTTLAGSMLAAILGAIVLFRHVDRSPMWRRVRLENIQRHDEGWVASDRRVDLEGRSGTALTDLRPAGAAEIDGVRYDVVSEAPFIEQGSAIRVLKHEGYRIVVQVAREPDDGRETSEDSEGSEDSKQSND